MAPKPSSPSQHQATISMYINWTKGLQSHHPKATSSTNRLHLHNHHQPSLSKHHEVHHIIRVLMGQQRTIISNQGSNHCTVTTARVTIRKAPHNCCWHQGQSSIWCWHQWQSTATWTTPIVGREEFHEGHRLVLEWCVIGK